MDIEWDRLTILQKKQMIINYVEKELKKNEEDYQNNMIDNLIYSKNNIFLESLKKDKKFLKSLKNVDVFIKDENIYQLSNIKRNTDDLIFYTNNKIMTQLKITDYNYKVVKNYIEYEKRNNKNRDL